MNYEQSIDYIHSIPKFRRPLGNANLEKLLTHLDNPQKLKFIHCRNKRQRLNCGNDCGNTEKAVLNRTFTSPYLEVFNERIRINGENITDNDLAEYVTRVKAIMEKQRTCFEFAFITAVSFLYFMKSNVILLFLKSVWAESLTQRTL